MTTVTARILRVGPANIDVRQTGDHTLLQSVPVAVPLNWLELDIGDEVVIEYWGEKPYATALLDDRPLVKIDLPSEIEAGIAVDVEPQAEEVEDDEDQTVYEVIIGDLAALGWIGLWEGPHIGLVRYKGTGDLWVILLEAADTANVGFFSVGINEYEINSKWLRIGYADAPNISLDPGSGGSEEHTGVVVQSECLEGADDGTLYIPFGDQGTDGSWRVIRDGDNLVHQRRESSAWVTKHTITP